MTKMSSQPVTSGLPSINYDDPFIYQHLSLIVDEFEKAALRSQDRQAIMATAQSPLAAMDQILGSSDTALSMGRTANAQRVSAPAGNNSRSAGGEASTSNGWEAPGFRLEGQPDSDESQRRAEQESWKEDHNDLKWVAENTSEEPERTGRGEIADIKEPSFTVGFEGSVSADRDFNDLLNGEPGGAQLGDWLADCLGCDLRISFDWQLQPIDLFLPLANLLADINAALDQFENWFNPNSMMENLCDLLNGLNFLCIPDLMAILMALKMLLKSYLTFQLSIRLDWTLLLGPLLKLILDALVTLLQQIAGIIVAPLDCAIAALTSIADLQDQPRQLLWQQLLEHEQPIGLRRWVAQLAGRAFLAWKAMLPRPIAGLRILAPPPSVLTVLAVAKMVFSVTKIFQHLPSGTEVVPKKQVLILVFLLVLI